jgi:hypothetical protein
MLVCTKHSGQGLAYSFFFFFFLFFAALGFEFRASCVLGRCCTTWAMPPAQIFFFFFAFLWRYFRESELGSWPSVWGSHDQFTKSWLPGGSFNQRAKKGLNTFSWMCFDAPESEHSGKKSQPVQIMFCCGLVQQHRFTWAETNNNSFWEQRYTSLI